MPLLTGSETLTAKFYIEGVYVTGVDGNSIPYMTWDVTSNGSSQSFTNDYLNDYSASEDMSVFLNGVFVSPSDFTISGNIITFTSFLNNGDLIEVASKTSGTGLVNANVITANVLIANTANLGNVANLTILGGSNGQVLTTDGNGDLSWTTVSGTGNSDRITSADGYSLSIGNTGVMTATTPSGSSTINFSNTGVAIGASAGSQATSAVAIGWQAGQNNQGEASIAIGKQSGFLDQGIDAVAVGAFAGAQNQGDYSVAVGGLSTGFQNQGNYATAVGPSTGVINQREYATAIGASAGGENQNYAAVAVGTGAGARNQGANAVAIGASAGRNNQAQNSIVLNATGANLENTIANSLVVKPVRGATTTANAMYYNSTTGEITYGPSAAGGVTQIVAGNGIALSPTNGIGVVTISSNVAVGNIANLNFNGNGMTFLAGNGVWTRVANATYADAANTANSVLLANVVGIGNIAGLNLGGNSLQFLAGNGAWVGPPTSVANATYANTAGVANSVALANVVGIGNISATNLNGNGSQVLLGNGVFGVPPSTPAGNNTQIQFNSNGALAASSNFFYDPGNGTFKVGGNITMVAIGQNAAAVTLATAIGDGAKVTAYAGVGIGQNANIAGSFSIGIGFNTKTTPNHSIAIGTNANVSADNSVAIGLNSIANISNTIVLGSNYYTARVPGNLSVTGTFTIGSQTAPPTASSTGTTGEIRWVNGFIYVCVATNTWQRSPLATW